MAPQIFDLIKGAIADFNQIILSSSASVFSLLAFFGVDPRSYRSMDVSKETKDPEHVSANASAVDRDDSDSEHNGKKPVPLSMKILSVVVVSMIGFGGHWSSGVTGALKSTLKKVSCLLHLEIEPCLIDSPETAHHQHAVCCS